MAIQRRVEDISVENVANDVLYSKSTLCIQHSALLYGAVLVSTGVVRLDKRAVAPDHDKTGIFLNLTDNNFVAQAA